MTDREISAVKSSIEGLQCVIVGPLQAEQPVKSAVVLLHGYGASGVDLVPCAPELLSSGGESMDNVVFIFPEAPLDLAEQGIPMGRAWWPINMARLMRIHDIRNFDEMASVVPRELPGESERIGRLLDVVAGEFNLLHSQIILGGFSQGAMLSCDVGLRTGGELGGLILWSGTFIAEPRWSAYALEARPLSIVQSHGTNDDILPFFAAENLRDFLKKHHHDVEFIGFQGFHQTHESAIKASAKLIVDCVNRR